MDKVIIGGVILGTLSLAVGIAVPIVGLAVFGAVVLGISILLIKLTGGGS